MEEERYKISEFAKKVNLSTKALRKLDKTGKLVAYRTQGGKHYGQRYYTDAHLDYYMENFAIAKCPHCGKNIVRY